MTPFTSCITIICIPWHKIKNTFSKPIGYVGVGVGVGLGW
jgi:hypothetical protein